MLNVFRKAPLFILMIGSTSLQAAAQSPSAEWTVGSNQSSSLFGSSVATAGDVNGDGYKDIIVGAPNFDNGQTDEGRVYVFHGSSSGLSLSPNWSAESNQAGAAFGCSVASAGDVNDDGYSDVIVGAYLDANGEFTEGRAYVYHGSAIGLSATPNWIGEINAAGALFGNYVASAGDVNGDGFSDVIIGARRYSNSHFDEGGAFVFHGSASGLSASPSWSIDGNQTSALLGESVGSAGDVNGDGYSDVLVGAPFYDNGQTDEGRVLLFLGSAVGLSPTAHWIGESNQGFSEYGSSVATAGSVNGDGYSDIIIGARNYDNPMLNAGRAFVYHGSPSGPSATPNWTSNLNQGSAESGNCVTTAGDTNADGYADVLIGARNYDNPSQNEGRVFLYLGSPSGLDTTTGWTSEGDQVGASFGYSIAVAGDVNGDWYPDVIIGAPSFDNPEFNEGQVFVYHGSLVEIPEIVLEVSANPPAVCGQTPVQFQYVVTTGSSTLPLQGVLLTADSPSACYFPSYLFGDMNFNGHLDPAESWVYQCETFVQGQWLSTATVSAQTIGPNPIEVYDADEVFINSSPPFPSQVSPHTAIICPDDPPVTLTAVPAGGTAPFSFQWSVGPTTESISVSVPGTYFLTVTDSVGCVSYADATLDSCEAAPCTWTPMGTGQGTGSPQVGIEDFAEFDEDGSGPNPPRLFATGSFYTMDGVPAQGIARWNGSSWSEIGTIETYPYGFSLEVFDPDGAGPQPAALYLGGSFTSVSGVIVNNLAKWNGTSWSGVGGGLNGPVYELLVVDEDGPSGAPPALFVGGAFSMAGGSIPAKLIARWNGSTWSAVGAGITTGESVTAMAWHDDDGAGPHAAALYVGGDFTAAGGVSAVDLAKWNGGSWSSLGGGTDGFGYIFDMTAFDEDGVGPNPARLFVAGTFYQVGGLSIPRLARWNGVAWSAVASGMADASVTTIKVLDQDGDGPMPAAMLCGGQYLAIGGIPARSIAQWNGTAWSPVGRGFIGNNSQFGHAWVQALVTFDPDGAGPAPLALHAGGWFSQAANGPSAVGVATFICNGFEPCPADITLDGAVNIDDLVLVITSWGAVGGLADITGNGIVNIDDLVEVITAWGMCP